MCKVKAPRHQFGPCTLPLAMASFRLSGSSTTGSEAKAFLVRRRGGRGVLASPQCSKHCFHTPSHRCCPNAQIRTDKDDRLSVRCDVILQPWVQALRNRPWRLHRNDGRRPRSPLPAVVNRPLVGTCTEEHPMDRRSSDASWLPWRDCTAQGSTFPTFNSKRAPHQTRSRQTVGRHRPGFG